jgi:hypothetical protein
MTYLSHISESCRYFHATTLTEQKTLLNGIKNKNARTLKSKKYANFLNYADTALSINDTVKSLYILFNYRQIRPQYTKIAQEPIYTSVIHKLHSNIRRRRSRSAKFTSYIS